MLDFGADLPTRFTGGADSMAPQAVYWHEGMFLQPHHFQAAERHALHRAHLSESWDHSYGWGLRSIEIDDEALGNQHLVVRALQGRLRDGSLVSVPADGVLPRLPLKAALEQHGSVNVFVGVPVLQSGRANAAPGAHPAEGVRFLVDALECEDENRGGSPRPVEVRRLNLTLLLSPAESPAEHAGYELLRIARVEKSARADGAPQLDPAYVPPLLACDAWKGLAVDVLQNVYDRIGRQSELLLTQVRTRGISFDSQSQGEARLFCQLRLLNEAYALLGVMAFARGVHPLTAYLELCRLVGQLSILDDAALVPPALPHYDHDDLGGCFGRVKQYLDHLLECVDVPTFEQRPFVGAGLRLQVALDKPTWLEPGWQMFIGVNSPLSSEECTALLSGGLRMKVGSANRVDELFARGMAGLKFTHAGSPPAVLPRRAGLTYFQIDRDSQKEEWDRVRTNLTVALRLNEQQVEGTIDKQEVLKVRRGGQATPMRFTLFVTPAPAERGS
jgi:type VI secretion system protein ImpJ